MLPSSSQIARAALLFTLLASVAALSQPSPDTIWSTPVNALAGPESLRKVGGCDGCYDAGAATTAVVASGDALAEVTFADTSGLRLVGFANAYSVTDPATIAFGVRIQAGWAEVREHGAYRADVRAEAGAIFRVALAGGVVRYSKNGVVFYVSTAAPVYPFSVGASLANADTDVTVVRFTGVGPAGGGSEAPRWSASANVSLDSNSVWKTSGCDGCYDAFVLSEQTLASFGGSVEFTAEEARLLRTAGLAHAFNPGDARSIDFAIRLQAGYAEVRENGIYRADVAFTGGSRFRIAVSHGVVRYSKDGVIFHETPASAGPLYVAALFADLGAMIGNVTISSEAVWAKVAAGGWHTLGIRPDGRLGDGTTSQPNAPIQVGSGFASAAAGDSHTVAVKTDGALWGWGNDDSGQLGPGGFKRLPLPTP